jgi:hypothetical protein
MGVMWPIILALRDADSMPTRWKVFLYIYSSVLMVLTLPMILIAFLFRFAVKSTVIIWLPLLWVIYWSYPGANVYDRIALNVKHPWTKLMLIYSLFVIAAFAAKILLLFHVWEFAELHLLGPLGELIMRLVEPFYLTSWQLTGFFSAGIAWLFFLRATRHLLARYSTEAWPEAWIQREYVGLQTVRTTLSLFTIACTFYIAATTAWQTEWPPIRIILFPWSPAP